MGSEEQQELLMRAINQLLDTVPLDGVVACPAPIDFGANAASPRTALLHVRFNEDKPQVNAMARFLWAQAVKYALSRRRRLEFEKALIGDITVAAQIVRVVREVFIEFRTNNPSRASEVGEVLAYCVAVHHLKAAQLAAKMSLKTSPNMPVHGLDGIHAVFESGALTLFFLESKLSKSANDGAREYAESVAGFLKDEKQYLREYELVGDLGNLNALEGEAREVMLKHLDVVGSPDIPRRERYVGVICYSEKKHFADKIPVGNGAMDVHEKHFASNYAKEITHHQKAAQKHVKAFGGDPNKCFVFFVAVPDIDDLREKFYEEMGISSPIAKPAPTSKAASKATSRSKAKKQ